MQNTIVPLYIFPFVLGTQAPWPLLVGKTGGNYNVVYESPIAHGLTRWIILEPDLTPGGVFDPNYAAVISNCHDTVNYCAPGTKVLPYIPLGTGTNTEATIFASIDKAASFYYGGAGSKLHFDGIFFDQAPNTQVNYSGTSPASYVTYLTDILNHAIGLSAFGPNVDYWFNVGFWPDETYMNFIPNINTCFILENTYAAWSTTDVADLPAWVKNYNSSRIGSVVHDTTQAQMQTGLVLANSMNMGTVYFTDGTGINPYIGLSSYHSQFLFQANSALT
jgi:Spherulation-specific family 4